MKKFLFLLLVLISSKIYSQNKETLQYNKVKTLYLSTTVSCMENDKEYCSIFFNKSEKSLDIINKLVPLTKVEVRYRYSEMIPGVKHFVQFICHDDANCIFDSKKIEYNNSLSVPFYSKEACYNFIEAVADLKELL